MRVLIVEDDPELAALLRDGLRAQRIDPTVAATFAAGREQAVLTGFDGIILHVRLADGTGLGLCGELRRRGVTTPVLMLTALDAVDDRVRGLEVGADDYLTKRSEEHTSELKSHSFISYAVFCLKKKTGRFLYEPPIHMFDMMRFLFGEVESVHAIGSTHEYKEVDDFSVL